MWEPASGRRPKPPSSHGRGPEVRSHIRTHAQLVVVITDYERFTLVGTARWAVYGAPRGGALSFQIVKTPGRQQASITLLSIS